MDMPQVRRPEFGLENNFSKYYADGNPFLSHLVNSLHVVFPEGEKLFIRAVKFFQDQVQDPHLKARIKGFIGQETVHMMQHERIWDTLESQGIKVREFDEWYTKSAYEEGIEGAIRKIFGEETYKRLALAVTCGLEHYTATLAEVALDPDLNVLKGFDDRMIALLEWHAAEEIEHKAVAFDVMQAVDGSPITKTAGLLLATWTLIYYGAAGTVKFMMEDEQVKITDLPRIVAEKTPLLAKAVFFMVPKVLQYLMPGFHPNDTENSRLAVEYFQNNKQYFEKKAG
ncbi:MAG: hypothetical protein LDLANPLL_02101 [Turneriella sp.]|nr:hypothetical protein [Turneriella sp.]